MGGYSRRQMVKMLAAVSGVIYGTKETAAQSAQAYRGAMVLVIPPEGIIIQAGEFRQQLTRQDVIDALSHKEPDVMLASVWTNSGDSVVTSGFSTTSLPKGAFR